MAIRWLLNRGYFRSFPPLRLEVPLLWRTGEVVLPSEQGIANITQFDKSSCVWTWTAPTFDEKYEECQFPLYLYEAFCLLRLDDLCSRTPTRLANESREWACTSGKFVRSRWRVGGRLFRFFLPPVLIHDFTPPRYTSLGTLVGAGGKHTCRCRPDEHDGELRQ